MSIPLSFPDYTADIDCFLKRLFPIVRSITGNGNRDTLRVLQEIIPLTIKEYPTNQKVYDWVIPEEWNIRDAWVKDSKGNKVIDFKNNNLHVMSYSSPVKKRMHYKDLRKHLFCLPKLPEAIPYRTSYYENNWGFCLSYDDFQKKFDVNSEYDVFIDSSFTEGTLSIGELIIRGKSKKEYLISTYICHPALANDNLSGVILSAFLAKELLNKVLNFSYRIIFVPETIGAIAYCANNEDEMKNIDCGFLVSCVGGPGTIGYKQSFKKNHYINAIIERSFQGHNVDYITYPFDINGSDERQYSSQGFRINMASITKDKYYEYNCYHTSLDNLDYVKAESINKSLMFYLCSVNQLDKNITYQNVYQNCEVMLGKHGVYPKIGGMQRPNDNINNELDIIRWLLFYCDGHMTLHEISAEANITIEILYQIAIKLEEKEILRRVG